MADIKQSIIASVFSRRNATGNFEETYVSHIKIWEDAGPEGRKARYILLSRMSAAWIPSQYTVQVTYSRGQQRKWVSA